MAAQANILDVDWNTIEERRRLSALRRQRESDRTALLVKLMKTGHRAAQLRAWLDENKAMEETDPAIARMLEWARRRLSELGSDLNPVRIAAILHDGDLFPETDPLDDPLGAPPARQPWGR